MLASQHCTPKSVAADGGEASIDARMDLDARAQLDAMGSMDADVANDATPTGDVCQRPVYPDGFPVIGRQPCLIVHPISRASLCTVEGAMIELRSEDEPLQVLDPGFHGVTTGTGGCRGSFTLSVTHPDFESSTTMYRSCMDRFSRANSSTQVVIIELTPQAQVAVDASAEN